MGFRFRKSFKIAITALIALLAVIGFVSLFDTDENSADDVNSSIIENSSNEKVASVEESNKITTQAETTTTQNETTTESTTVKTTTEKITQKVSTTANETTATQQNLNSDDYILYYDGEQYQLIEKSPEYKENEAKLENTTAFVITDYDIVYETLYSIESNNDTEIDGFENSFSDEINELINNMN